MKLEEGMYIRTKDGIIRQCKKITERIYDFEDLICFKEDINIFIKTIQASHNIIDLIEAGDYVNGCFVFSTNKSYDSNNSLLTKSISIISDNDLGYEILSNKDIKSIVTKEQFSQMEYKVGE